MGTAATIALFGEPGPFRAELLAHREIDLLWAVNAEELNDHLSSSLVDACVVGPIHAGDPELRLPDDLPTVLLVDSAEAGALLSRSPSRTVQIVAGCESLVRLLEGLTKIKMAKEPRIDLRVAAAISIDGSRYLRETTDLSRSGVGIARFPEGVLGGSVELVLDLPSGPIWLEALVVRRFMRDGEPITGLSFTQMSREVATALGELIDGPLPTELPASEAPADELEQLRALLSSAGTIEAPRWLMDLANELTPLEITAARGGQAPEWAQRGLPLWMAAARARSRARLSP